MKELENIFRKHGMCTIEGSKEEKSIFGIDENDRMCMINNNLKTAFPYIVYGNNSPKVNLTEFANDAKEAFEKSGIKKFTGDYKIFMDDGDVLVIEADEVIYG